MTKTEEPRHGRLWRPEVDSLAGRVARRFAMYFDGIGEELGVSVEFRVGDEQISLEDRAKAAIESIVAFARTGDPARLDAAGMALLLVQRSLRGVLAAPAKRGVNFRADLYELEEVTNAAYARRLLLDGKDVPRAKLAALAGVDESEIRRSIREGRLSTSAPRKTVNGGHDTSDLTPASARAWLVSRGVLGV